MSITIFLISFVGGPAIFWILARQRPAPSYFAALAIATLLLAGGAYVLPLVVGTSVATGVAAVLQLWLGWIMVLALCALAVRARAPEGLARKLAFAICAMATTLPWFGLHVAAMMGS